MPENLLTEDDAVTALVAHVFSGAIGPSDGKGVCYALLETTPSSFSWSAALDDMDESDAPVDRYLIKIDRQTKEFSAPKPIVLSEQELADAVLSATGQHLSSWARFTDGSLSVS